MTVARYYKPELDVLRLFAFLFVFFVHRLDLAPVDSNVYYWGYHLSLIGNYGVPLFFFLSAFLITELLGREEQEFGKINIKSFYIRRMLRIWPLYFTFFFGMVLLTHTTGYFGTKIPPGTQLAFTLFSGNWYITFNEWQSYCINPLWSVSVEEQLYILLPLVLFFTKKKGLKTFSFFAIIVAYGTIIYYAFRPTTGFSGQWTNSFVQFQFFAAGILLSVYLKGRQPKLPAALRLVLFIAGIICWLLASMVCGINADAPHVSTLVQSVTGWLLILVGVLFMFFSLFGASEKYMPSPLVYLGRISYGMYVFHITVYWIVYHIFKDELAAFSKNIGLYEWRNEVGFVIAFVITVTISILSYKYFEKPFLKLKTRFTLVPSRD
ncbi:acyltransferase family protein [Niabella beijingensis]|uniref:acyltransferase family protein n=1 Tax=Niabella beijingensis TaxID=2872700 RepID=UPI001CBD5500|nr:acyltransferase [Niabella beijingensis]MBZ4192651.1 acyltransferase [Niabella beijingensis]